MTRGTRSFIWSDTKEEAFQALRQALCETPVLPYPTRTGEFVLYTDASAEAIGSVLSQRQADGEKVIAYASKPFSRIQTQYCITHRELFAIMTFGKYFHHNLCGRPFTIITDHADMAV